MPPHRGQGICNGSCSGSADLVDTSTCSIQGMPGTAIEMAAFEVETDSNALTVDGAGFSLGEVIPTVSSA